MTDKKQDCEARVAFDLFKLHLKACDEANEIFSNHKKLLSLYVKFHDAVKDSEVPEDDS